MATSTKEPGLDFRDDQPAADAATLQHDLRENLVNQYPNLADSPFPEKAVSPEQLFMTFKEVVQQPENDYETVRETALLLAEKLQGPEAELIQSLTNGNVKYSELNPVARRNCPETYDAVMASAAKVAEFRQMELKEEFANALTNDKYYPMYDNLLQGNQMQDLLQRLEALANGAYTIEHLQYQDPTREPALGEALLQYWEAVSAHGAAQLQEMLERNPELSERLAQRHPDDTAALGRAMLDYVNGPHTGHAHGLVDALVGEYLERHRYQLANSGQDAFAAGENIRYELRGAYEDAVRQRQNYTDGLLAAHTFREGGYPTPEPGLADFDTETQQRREWAWMMYPQSANAVYEDLQHRFEQTGNDPERMLGAMAHVIADLPVRTLLRGLDDIATGETPPSEKYAPETYSDPNLAAEYDVKARDLADNCAYAIRHVLLTMQHAAINGDSANFVERAATLHATLAYASQIPAETDAIVNAHARHNPD